MRRKSTRRALIAVALLLLLSCGVWIFWQRKAPEETPAKDREYLLVPRDLAGRFGLTGPKAVIAWCHDNIQPASYDGIFRGAHGALWAGEANAWDRVLLAVEALVGIGIKADVVPGDPPRLTYLSGQKWHTVRFGSDRPPEVSAQPPAGAGEDLASTQPQLFHQVTAVLVLESEAGPPQRVPAKTPQMMAHWVYQPVFLSAAEDKDGLRYILQVGDQEVLTSGSLTNVRRAVLELTWHFKEKDTVWQRELFDRACTPGEVPGHSAPAAGDRYGLILAAGPLVPEVLKTRIRMLEKLTPIGSKVQRDLVTLGAKYHVDTDQHTAKLIEQTKITAAWTTPRLIITASEAPVAKETDGPPPGLSLDVLADQVEAQGPRSREFHVARGLANDLIETRIVYEATKMPVISATTVLSRFHADSPETPNQRLQLIEAAVRRLAAEEPNGTRLKLEALPPRVEQVADAGKDKEPPHLIVERQKKGLVLIGVGEKADVARGLVTDRYRWEPEKRVAFGSNTEALAVVADCLLSQQLQKPDYLLRLKMQSGWPTDPLPVTVGSVLTYRVKHGGTEYLMDVLVSLKDGDPLGGWSTKPMSSINTWIDPTGRLGAVSGLWPDVISSTSMGPGLECYLAAPGFDLKGESVQFKVAISNQTRVLDAMKVPWPRKTSSLAAVEKNGKLQAAVFVRRDGLVYRGEESYLVHYLGAKGDAEEWAARDSLQLLHPVEVEVKGQWRLGHLLQTEGQRSEVQLLDEEKAVREWVTPERLRAIRLVEAQLQGQWRPASLLDAKDDKFQVHRVGAEGDKGEWLDKKEIRLCEAEAGKDDYLVVLPGSQAPLLVEGRLENASFVLKRASPVLRGKVVDRDTGQPVGGATVARADGTWKVQSAVDGTFALHLDDPLFPMTTLITASTGGYLKHPTTRRGRGDFKFLMVLDQSDRMKYGLDPESSTEMPAGKQRQDALRTEVMRFLRRSMSTFDSGRISIWTYATLPGYKGSFAEPELVTELLKKGVVEGAGPRHPQFDVVEAVLPKLQAGGEAPLTAVINKLGGVDVDPQTPVILFTTGANACTSPTAAEAYVAHKCRMPIHIFGLGVKPGSPEEKQLRTLAEISGGSLRLALLAKGPELDMSWAPDANNPYGFHLNAFSSPVGSLGVTVREPCHLPATVLVPLAEAGQKPREVALAHDCQCQAPGKDKEKDKRLLVISRNNLAQLAECDGLTARARKMIEERVAGGAWTVTIPSQRVNIAGVTAYGWFETEVATGRMIGRTEDGLHGATPKSGGWPNYNPYKSGPFKQAANQLPFTAWYQGVVAYTVGSVKAGLTWHQQPGFLNGSPEDFKRFVQANALDFTSGWWDKVGAKSFPEHAELFWAGVCLNFTLQGEALGLPGDSCLRHWAENLCNRAADATREKGKDLAGKALQDFLKSQFGGEFTVLVGLAGKAGFGGLVNELNQMWQDGVNEGFNCKRFQE